MIDTVEGVKDIEFDKFVSGERVLKLLRSGKLLPDICKLCNIASPNQGKHQLKFFRAHSSAG
jgi:hypothetical protein